jgi:hypothetical protein
MAKGLEGIREAAAEIAARRQGSGRSGQQWFRIQAGESATVRFLEQGDDVAWSYAHQLDAKDGQKFGDWEPCLNTNNDGTPCPGCEQRRPRRVRGFINLIWRDGPIYEREEFKREDGSKATRLKRDNDGKPILAGRGPIIATWASGVQLFEELDGLDAAIKGLTTRDFQVTRRGTELNTKYQLIPLDATPLTDEDRKLAAEKPDLAPYVTPKPYEEWGKDSPGNGGGGQQKHESQAENVNPFKKPRSD